MDPSIFKAYDIRGIYPDQLDEDAAWKIGHATAQFLRSLPMKKTLKFKLRYDIKTLRL